MCYLMREAVELVLNEGSDLEDFLTVVLKRNDSGKEFVSVDLEALE